MSDYIFKAFIVNRFEYDNGNKETSGAWLYLPTDAETVKRTFEEIGLSENASPDKYFFDDYVCGNDDLKKCFSQYESVDALNYLATRISELEDVEMTVFQAAIKTKNCENIKDAINITYNTECFDIVCDMGSWKNVGAYIAEREGLGVEVLGQLSNYMDYATYGRAYANDNGGYLVDDVYVEKNSVNFTEKYNGNIEDIPPEYLVTEQDKPQTMTVLVVEPMKEPHTKEIPTELEALQKEVGGNIQVVYPFAEPIGLICNDEGKMNGLELNRALYDAESEMYDIIAGTFVLAGLAGDSFGSLDKEQIKQFSERFAKPEIFMRINGKIKAVKAKPSIKAALDKMKKEQDGRNKPQPQKKPPNQEL